MPRLKLSPRHTVVLARAHGLPDTPGVYLWKDAEGRILYVGKAKRLRRRVASYLTRPHSDSAKTQAMVAQIDDFEWISVPTETDALALEETLIKQHRPRYNIALVDDHRYPYVKVTLNEPFPRVLVVRNPKEDGARYLGPFTDAGALRAALAVIRQRFPVRTCSYALPTEAPDRPCLEYHIRRCRAPCVGLQSQPDYRAMITDVLAVLDGRTTELLARLDAEMQAASTAMAYERAGELRDQIRGLSHGVELPIVATGDAVDRDVFGVARDGDEACVVRLRIRGGRVVTRDLMLLDQVQDAADDAVLGVAIDTKWRVDPDRAREVLVARLTPALRVCLTRDASVTVAAPRRGPRQALVAMAEENARHVLDDMKLAAGETTSRTDRAVTELQTVLGLHTPPRRMVCFDIATGHGRDTVAGMVAFANGRPDKRSYRTYHIRTVTGGDDFAAMTEVLTRYGTRLIAEAAPPPDLIVIDGGPGQLNVAVHALAATGVTGVTVISLAKREELIFRPGVAEPLALPTRSTALTLLQQLRDETHRTANSFHRRARSARTLQTALADIPGVGPSRVRALLRRFGSVQAVAAASADELRETPGISAALATRIHATVNASAHEPQMPSA
jgi:excinuclease ABC subunit C